MNVGLRVLLPLINYIASNMLMSTHWACNYILSSGEGLAERLLFGKYFIEVGARKSAKKRAAGGGESLIVMECERGERRERRGEIEF